MKRIVDQDRSVMTSDSSLSDNVKTTPENLTPDEPRLPASDPAVGAAAAPPDTPAAKATDSVAGAEETMTEVSTDAAETPPAALTEPAPETTATGPPAEAEAESADSPGSEPSTATPGPSRFRLNPTVDQETAKAVPSVGSAAAMTPASPVEVTGGSPPTEATAAPPIEPPTTEQSTEETVAKPVSQPTAASPPVELPPKDVELDAALEAEIEAAVQAEESVAVPVDAMEAPEGAEAEPAEGMLATGTRLKAKVQSVHGDNVFFDLDGRSPGVVSGRQFATGKPPVVGDEFDVVVDRIDESEGLVLLNLPRGKRSIGGNWDAVSKGQIVDCMVTKTNKGGLEVTVSSLRGFMPASQVDLGYVGDLEAFIGQKLRAIITEANPKKRNLIVSRRKYLDIERQEQAEELWKTLKVGQEFSGTIRSIKDYGAFVDIGGVDGFLHVGEISWSRLNHPTDVLSVGQEVQVQVIKLDAESKRISLGMKQLLEDPWISATINYPSGATLRGRVTRTMDFGAFVELEPGVEGLIHISELDHQRVNKVTDVLQVDQEVELKVLEVDPERRRIGLSLKQMTQRPQEKQTSRAEEAAEEAAALNSEPTAETKRKGPLKGGTGGDKDKGGLFGNPNDFS